MVANLVSKWDPKIARNLRISCENWDFPSPKLQFSSHKIRFSSTAFGFPRNPRKSSSTAFKFLQRLSAFFNGFLLSKKSKKIFFNGFPISLMAFQFLQWLSSTKLFISWMICSASKLFISWIICRHSPHSLASVKDMYVQMGFQLNLYRHSLLKLYSKHWTDTRLKQEKCAYQPMILDQRYSNVGLATPLVNISPSCSEVSIWFQAC